jgi:DNA-binding NtrC family response regulator
MEKLASYDWPGNIREFRNLMERTVLVCPEEEVDVPHLPDRMAGRGEGTNGLSIPDGTSLAEGTRLMILRTLSQCSGNKTKAARVLGMSRKALYDRLRLYGKEP